jgi:hypothetical protein
MPEYQVFSAHKKSYKRASLNRKRRSSSHSKRSGAKAKGSRYTTKVKNKKFTAKSGSSGGFRAETVATSNALSLPNPLLLNPPLVPEGELNPPPPNPLSSSDEKPGLLEVPEEESLVPEEKPLVPNEEESLVPEVDATLNPSEGMNGSPEVPDDQANLSKETGEVVEIKILVTFSDTHCGNKTNDDGYIEKIIEVIKALYSDISDAKGISVIFNGDYFPRADNWSGKPENLLVALKGLGKGPLIILNLGNHEFIGGTHEEKEKFHFIEFVNAVRTMKDEGYNIHMMNSNLLSAFNDNETKVAIKDIVEPYIVAGNVGYVGWDTMEAITNTRHSYGTEFKNHRIDEWFGKKYIKDGEYLSGILNLRHGRKAYTQTEAKATDQISQKNVIVRDFRGNVKKCIEGLLKSNENKLYLNVSAHGSQMGNNSCIACSVERTRRNLW